MERKRRYTWADVQAVMKHEQLHVVALRDKYEREQAELTKEVTRLRAALAEVAVAMTQGKKFLLW